MEPLHVYHWGHHAQSCRLYIVPGDMTEGRNPARVCTQKGAVFLVHMMAPCRWGSPICEQALGPMQMRVRLALPGYEPLTPLPPAAASAPVWQDRTIASSRLRLLEYSAFMEVQRDPDTVTCLWLGVRVCATWGDLGGGAGPQPRDSIPVRPSGRARGLSPDPALGPPHSTANTYLCTSARPTPPSQTRL